jgi:hypothetical protein
VALAAGRPRAAGRAAADAGAGGRNHGTANARAVQGAGERRCFHGGVALRAWGLHGRKKHCRHPSVRQGALLDLVSEHLELGPKRALGCGRQRLHVLLEDWRLRPCCGFWLLLRLYDGDERVTAEGRVELVRDAFFRCGCGLRSRWSRRGGAGGGPRRGTGAGGGLEKKYVRTVEKYDKKGPDFKGPASSSTSMLPFTGIFDRLFYEEESVILVNSKNKLELRMIMAEVEAESTTLAIWSGIHPPLCF